MPLDIRDVESSLSYGKVAWEKFIKEQTGRFYAPMALGLLAMFMQQIKNNPALMAKMPGDKFARVQEMIGGENATDTLRMGGRGQNGVGGWNPQPQQPGMGAAETTSVNGANPLQSPMDASYSPNNKP